MTAAAATRPVMAVRRLRRRRRTGGEPTRAAAPTAATTWSSSSGNGPVHTAGSVRRVRRSSRPAHDSSGWTIALGSPAQVGNTIVVGHRGGSSVNSFRPSAPTVFPAVAAEDARAAQPAADEPGTSSILLYRGRSPCAVRLVLRQPLQVLEAHEFRLLWRQLRPRHDLTSQMS